MIFSSLLFSMPHNLVEEKLTELIEQNCNREGSLHLACKRKRVFFTSEIFIKDINRGPAGTES